MSAFPENWSEIWDFKEPIDLEEFKKSDLLADRRGFYSTVGRGFRASGIISFIASVLLVSHILRSHDRLSTTYHRLVFGLSLSDITSSIMFAMSTTFVPKELNYWIPGASGNLSTCTLQGFGITFGYAVAGLYNSSICFYYLAIIKYNKKDEYIRKKLEPWFHALAVGPPLVTSSIALAMQGFNTLATYCSLITYEAPHCIGQEESGVIPDGEFTIPCDRGNGGKYPVLLFVARLIGYAYMVIITPISIAICMFLMYRTVAEIERKVLQYGVGSLANIGQQDSISDIRRRVREQNMSYSTRSTLSHQNFAASVRSQPALNASASTRSNIDVQNFDASRTNFLTNGLDQSDATGSSPHRIDEQNDDNAPHSKANQQSLVRSSLRNNLDRQHLASSVRINSNLGSSVRRNDDGDSFVSNADDLPFSQSFLGNAADSPLSKSYPQDFVRSSLRKHSASSVRRNLNLSKSAPGYVVSKLSASNTNSNLFTQCFLDNVDEEDLKNSIFSDESIILRSTVQRDNRSSTTLHPDTPLTTADAVPEESSVHNRRGIMKKLRTYRRLIPFMSRESNGLRTNLNSFTNRKKAVVHMAMGYAMAWCSVNIPFIIHLFVPAPEFGVVAAYLTPLQGLFNFLVFMSPKVRIAKRRRGGENSSWFNTFIYAYLSRGDPRNSNSLSQMPRGRRGKLQLWLRQKFSFNFLKFLKANPQSSTASDVRSIQEASRSSDNHLATDVREASDGEASPLQNSTVERDEAKEGVDDAMP